MKNKNTRRMVAGVLAAALVLQSSALTAVSVFADEAASDEAVQAAAEASSEETTASELGDATGGEMGSGDEEETTEAETTGSDAEDPTEAPSEETTESAEDTTTSDTEDTTELEDKGAPDDELSISGGISVPDELKQGSYLIVKGTISSVLSEITSVDVSVLDSSGNKVFGGTAHPGDKTYDLNGLDRYIEFNKLTPGSYTFKVTVTNQSQKDYVILSQDFTVVSEQSAADTLSVSGGTSVPAELKQGATVAVRGTLTSAASNISSVIVGVYDNSGNKLCGGEAQPNAKSFDLSSLDKDVTFNKLAEGEYTYKVIASNEGNANLTVVTQSFNVVGSQAVADALTISGGTEVPDTLKQGSPLSITGTVSSASSNITYLTAGVYDANGVFVTGKTIAPNTKTYDLRRLDSSIAFDTLAPGKYTYAVIASNAANTNYALVNKQFTISGADAETSAADTLSISNASEIPDHIDQGKTLSIGGIVTSASSNITSLTAGVYDANGKFVTGKTIAPKTKSYDLKNLDSYVTFNTLPAGTYTYAVIATNAGNTNFALVDKKFTVGNAAAAEDDKMSITGGTTIPENLALGKALSIGGTVASASSNITALTVGVYDMNGTFVTGRTIAPNAKSYDLAKLDNYVAFNKLAAGKYVYAVIATNGSTSNYALVNTQFTVGNGGASETPGNTTTSPSEDGLTITGGTTIPDTLALGKALSIRGIVTSASTNITALTAGVYDMSGKFITGKSINPNAKSYDLKNLDNYIAFNTLPAGNYVYAVIASNGSQTNYALVNKQFTVGNGGTSTPSADGLTITGGTTIPDTIAVGKSLSIGGTVTSASSNITALTAGVYDMSGKFITGKSINPNAKSYDLKELDKYIVFNTLPEGQYMYAVIASNSSQTNYALVSKLFTVGSGSSNGNTTTNPSSDALSIANGTTIPDTLAVGKALSIGGTVTSASSNITSLTAGVYDANGKFITGKTIAPNAKSYDLKNLDNYITFNTLTAGTYTYAVIASNASVTNYALVSKKFTVGSGSSNTPSNNNGENGLSIANGTSVPSTIAQGKALSIRGVVSSDSTMTSLTAGVYDANGKFVTGRTIAPNAKSYDLKNLDNYIEFNKLAAGKYTYAVIASNASATNYALVNVSFTVTGDGSTGSSTNSSDRITISGGTSIPGTVTLGKGVIVRGTLSSESNITSVTVGVYDANGKLATGTTVSPNAKSYNLNQVDSQIRFDKLAAGTYTYKVTATNGASSGYTVVNQSFTVK